jgi:hypothetical protein
VTIANITDGPNGKPAVCFLPFQATMRCKNFVGEKINTHIK